MKKADKFLIGTILVLALGAYLVFWLPAQTDSPLWAEISVDGQAVWKANLTDLTGQDLLDIDGPLGTSVVEVKPGAIRMNYSPCPDHYCMETGWINRPGRLIVCVPNRIVVKIYPNNNSPDTISN